MSDSGRPLRRGTVERLRLTRRLESGAAAALTLVEAPAGYGKTLAVRTWLDRVRRPTAWVAVDERDNDAVRLWSAVAAAVERARPGTGARALELLRTPLAAVAPAIDALADALTADVVVVLDDVQLLDDEHCLQSLDYAIEALPERVQLVVIARAAPRRMRIARLRSQGRLVELGAGELAFTPAEARQVLRAVGLTAVGDAELDELIERTEGWPAAVYLMALHLRNDSGERPLRAPDGSHRHFADYFAREIVHALDPETRRLLIRGSALPQLTGELCDTVLGTRDGGLRLRELERSNLLVTELSGRRGCYVLHALLRDYLAAELDAAEPGAAVEIQRRALEWSRARGLVEDAAAYAQACGDWDTLADLVEAHQLALTRAGRAATVARWTAALPRALLVDRPGVLVGAISAGHAVGQAPAAIARLLTLARREMDRRPQAWKPQHRCIAHAGLGLYGEPDIRALLTEAETAVEIARAGVDDLLVFALGVVAAVRLLAGDDRGAAAAAREALAHSNAAERPFGYIGALATSAWLEAAAGRPTLARAHADEALASTRDPALVTSSSTAFGHLSNTVTCALEGHLGRAERAAERAVRSMIPGGLWQAWTAVELAAIQVRRGRLTAAERSLALARELLGVAGDAGRIPALADTVEGALAAARAGVTVPLAEPPSPAELAVLRLLDGRTVREIGAELYLSPNTVKTHVRALYRKLGVSTRADAVARAAALGLYDDAGHDPRSR